MDREFINKMQLKLELMRHDLLDVIYSESKEFKELQELDCVNDFGDSASRDYDTKLIAFRTLSEYKRLNLVISALGRIKNNSYGYCLRSGKEIPKERLEAVPYALFGVEVQKTLDRRIRF